MKVEIGTYESKAAGYVGWVRVPGGIVFVDEDGVPTLFTDAELGR